MREKRGREGGREGGRESKRDKERRERQTDTHDMCNMGLGMSIYFPFCRNFPSLICMLRSTREEGAGLKDVLYIAIVQH